MFCGPTGDYRNVPSVVRGIAVQSALPDVAGLLSEHLWMRTRVEQARSEVMDSIAELSVQPHDTGKLAAQLKERFLAFCDAADERLGECTAQVLRLRNRS